MNFKRNLRFLSSEFHSRTLNLGVIEGKGLACSRRSDSAARAKNKASERGGKKRGETGEESLASPRFFPALSLAFFFARAALSERLEQARKGLSFNYPRFTVPKSEVRK